jgi:hypothetical protein
MMATMQKVYYANLDVCDTFLDTLHAMQKTTDAAAAAM